MKDLLKKCVILGLVGILIFTSSTFCINANLTLLKIKNQNNYLINFSPDDKYEYVIITNEYLKDSDFQRLIQHKSQYLNSTIVTIEDVLNNPDFKVNGTYGDATNAANGNHWIADGKEVTANFSIDGEFINYL